MLAQLESGSQLGGGQEAEGASMEIRRTHLGLSEVQGSKDVLHPPSFLDEKTKAQRGQVTVQSPGRPHSQTQLLEQVAAIKSLIPEDAFGPAWGCCPPGKAGEDPRKPACDLKHAAWGFHGDSSPTHR